VATRPIAVKLSPVLPDIAGMARVAEQEGADAVTLVNTIPGMLDRRLGNGAGGVSGPALLAIGVLATRKVRTAVAIPVIGVGGIRRRATRASTSPRARRSWRSAPPPSPIRASRSAWRGSSAVAELIVAFDLPSGREALELAARLPGLRWAKIGPMLHVREGPALVREFTARGVRVFLGLKWPDLPSVRAGARAAGLRGVVASGHELALLREMLGPDAWIVVPGVRAPGDAPDDQARTIAVADAVGRGATHLVVGRPITRAADPRGVYQRLMESL